MLTATSSTGTTSPLPAPLPDGGFIPNRQEGEGCDKHIWIGDRGAIFVKKGRFTNPAACQLGFDSEKRTYIGPQGGMWVRLGWWTDVVRKPNWLHEDNSGTRAAPTPGFLREAVPPPRIPPLQMAVRMRGSATVMSPATPPGAFNIWSPATPSAEAVPPPATPPPRPGNASESAYPNVPLPLLPNITGKAPARSAPY